MKRTELTELWAIGDGVRRIKLMTEYLHVIESKAWGDDQRKTIEAMGDIAAIIEHEAERIDSLLDVLELKMTDEDLNG